MPVLHIDKILVHTQHCMASPVEMEDDSLLIEEVETWFAFNYMCMMCDRWSGNNLDSLTLIAKKAK